MAALGRADLTPVFVGWREAAAIAGLGITTLRRLIRAGVLSPPLALAGTRKAFRRSVFLAELEAHVERLNRNASEQSSGPNACPGV